MNILNFKQKLRANEMANTINQLISISANNNLWNINRQLHLLFAQYRDWEHNVKLGMIPQNDDSKLQHIRSVILDYIDRMELGADTSYSDLHKLRERSKLEGVKYGKFHPTEVKTYADFLEVLDERARRMRILFNLLDSGRKNEFNNAFNELHERYKTAIVSQNIVLMHDLNREIQEIIIEARNLLEQEKPMKRKLGARGFYSKKESNRPPRRN